MNTITRFKLQNENDQDKELIKRSEPGVPEIDNSVKEVFEKKNIELREYSEEELELELENAEKIHI
jgi:methyl-accepting chemotaxis protein